MADTGDHGAAQDGAPAREDPRPSIAYGPLGWLVEGMNAIGTLLIIALMLLINTDVIGRNFLLSPVPGVVEMTEAAIVIIVFLQVGHTLQVGRFTRSDGLYNVLKARRPRIAAALEIVYSLAGAALFGVLAWIGFQRFQDAWAGGYFKGVLNSFTFPTWPLELTMAIGSGVMVLLFLGLAFDAARLAAFGPRARL